MDFARRRLIIILMMIFCALSFYAASRMIFDLMSRERTMIENTKDHAMEQTIKAAKQIDKEIADIYKLVDLISADVYSGDLSEESLRANIQSHLKEMKGITSVGVFYEPYAFSKEKESFAINYSMSANAYKASLQGIEKYSSIFWYKQAKLKGPRWTEPYRDIGGSTILVSYCIPFYVKNNSKPAGVIRVAIDVDFLKYIIGNLELGKSGYGYVVSDDGTFISYPLTEYLDGKKKIFDVAKELDNQKLMEISIDAIKGRISQTEFCYKKKGENYWLFYYPIKSANWTLGSIFMKDDLSLNSKPFRREKIRISVLVIVFLILFFMLVFKVYLLGRKNMWWFSSVFSLLCIAGTCYLWILTLTAPLYEGNGSSVITDSITLDKCLEKYVRLSKKTGSQPPVFIPTGLIIRTVEFSGPNNVILSGHVWQTYIDGITDGIKKGFSLPEAKSFKCEEIFRHRENKVEIIGWNFEATLRECFEYSKYPFDRPDIWIWLKHVEFYKNVVLVPDLMSYKLIAPMALPGLQDDLALPDFYLLGTYFDYRYKYCSANYGFINNTAIENFPELYYNIIIRRKLLSPFVSKIFPILIIMCLLFIILLKFSRDEDQMKAYGISGMGVLGTIISLLFPTLLSQFSIRTELAAEGVTFVEYFHFTTYFILLLVAIIAYIFTSKKNNTLIQYGDCILPKILFWPLVTSIIFIISLVNFY